MVDSLPASTLYKTQSTNKKKTYVKHGKQDDKSGISISANFIDIKEELLCLT